MKINAQMPIAIEIKIQRSNLLIRNSERIVYGNIFNHKMMESRPKQNSQVEVCRSERVGDHFLFY